MDAASRHLEWRHFRELIEQGVPAVQLVSGSPEVSVFVDEAGSRIGLRTPVSPGSELDPSPVAEIQVAQVMTGGRPCLEVSTRTSALFGEFYALLEDLADRMQLQGQAPQAAFRDTLINWRALLRPTERMSDEQRLGLFGELIVLDRILGSHGPASLASWTGPMGEPHDFRLGSNEIEVKTTSSRKRHHLISSVEQLEPSPGRQLYLLSVQLEPAGNEAGLALPELVDLVRTKLTQGSGDRDVFETSLLVAWRYSDVHAPLYRERFQLRTPVTLMEVSDDFPRITPSFVADLPSADRITDVQYRISVDGFGHVDGTPEFEAILPGVMAL